MNETAKVTRKEVQPILDLSFPEYTGRKIKVEFAEKITFYDMNWSGGTKNSYVCVTFDSKVKAVPAPAPWMNPIEGKTVEIPENVMIVEHSYFCGHDMGIRIYAHPSHAPKFLKA